MFDPVDPVLAARPTTGLVAAALTPNDGSDWQRGLAWRSERCPEAVPFDPACGLDGPFGTVEGDEGDSLNYYVPMAFRVVSACATRARQSDEDMARIRRQAEAVTSYMIAREVQDGALTRANPYDTTTGTDATNAYLAGPDAVVEAGTWDPYAGLGRVEELARQAALGMDPFIHMPVRMVPLVANALIREGNLLRTMTGARVVADAGYTGGGVLSAGTAEVQTITITGAPTGGTFTLTWMGDTTGPIAFDATAATVQGELLDLDGVDDDDLAVTGAAGGPWTVTFGAHLGNVAQLTADGSGLTGGVAPAVNIATTTPGVAPAATAGNWIYATGPVQVRLGEIITYEAVDRSFNQHMAVAERLFAATFDRCNIQALEIDVPATA